MATRKSAQSAPITEGRLVVTQVKSSIGTKPKHRGTLRALGLDGARPSQVRYADPFQALLFPGFPA